MEIAERWSKCKSFMITDSEGGQNIVFADGVIEVCDCMSYLVDVINANTVSLMSVYKRDGLLYLLGNLVFLTNQAYLCDGSLPLHYEDGSWTTFSYTGGGNGQVTLPKGCGLDVAINKLVGKIFLDGRYECD